MPRKEDILHSVLIVSSSEKFDAVVRQLIQGYVMVDSRKSTAMARRCILERYYDLVVINAPLPDESGEQFAIDAAQGSNASVLLVNPSESYEAVLEHVTDHGILVLSKPVPRGQVEKAIRFLFAQQGRMRQMEKKISSLEDKMEEIRMVTKAKFYLVENHHMSEDEAHRYIGKMAMDNGISRGKAAERVLEDF